MLALSQATTERLLAEALEAAGGAVERGVRMTECRNVADGVEVVLEAGDGRRREVAHGPWLLAADGAHSAARERLGVEFEGSSFPQEWYLADVPLRTSLAADQAHVFFLDRGEFVFMIRVVEDAARERGDSQLWRIIRNRPAPLAGLVAADVAGPAVWTSSFRIAHRVNAALAVGRVYFAGDAAHVHSPVGARGMNLGLEAAWVFAELARRGQLAAYDRLRRPVDRSTVRKVELLSRVAAGQSWFSRLLRAVVFPRAIGLRPVRARMIATVTGLDHELRAEAGPGRMSPRPLGSLFRRAHSGSP